MARHHRRASARKATLDHVEGPAVVRRIARAVRAAQDHLTAKPSQNPELPQARRTQAARRRADRADRRAARTHPRLRGDPPAAAHRHAQGRGADARWSDVDLDHRVIRLPKRQGSGENRPRRAADRRGGRGAASLPRLARGGWVFFGRRRAGHSSTSSTTGSRRSRAPGYGRSGCTICGIVLPRSPSRTAPASTPSAGCWATIADDRELRISRRGGARSHRKAAERWRERRPSRRR